MTWIYRSPEGQDRRSQKNHESFENRAEAQLKDQFNEKSRKVNKKGMRHEVWLENSERKINTHNGAHDLDFFADFWILRIFLRFSLDSWDYIHIFLWGGGGEG